MKFLKLLLIFVVFANPVMSFASSNMVVKVKYVGMYGDGELFIETDSTIDESSCADNRLVVEPNHPNKKEWMSIALTAFASGKSLRIKTNYCYSGKPALDQSKGTWLYILE